MLAERALDGPIRLFISAWIRPILGQQLGRPDVHIVPEEETEKSLVIHIPSTFCGPNPILAAMTVRPPTPIPLAPLKTPFSNWTLQ